jgi:RHS repeat-associated protein
MVQQLLVLVTMLSRPGVLQFIFILNLALTAAPVPVSATSELPAHVSAQGERVVTGQVLSAQDKKPRAAVPIRLGVLSVETDAQGRFRLINPPTGPQLVHIDHAWLETKRRTLPDGASSTPAHADPVLVLVPEEGSLALSAPIYLVEPSSPTHALLSERAIVIRPAHIPEMTVRIPKGVKILADNGQPQTELTITALPPDRAPPLPPQVAPRTLYLFSFGHPGGGTATEPIQIEYPNELNAPPGEPIDLWYYDKTTEPDPASHQWKIYGQGTVSPDGRRIVPNPGVGQPKFCITYPNWPNMTNPQISPTGDTGGDPVDLSSGVLTLQRTELTVPGILPVAITRSYRTQAAGIGPFGLGGSFNFDVSMQPVALTYSFLMPNGNRFTLSQDADGKYRNTAHPFLRGAALTKFADNHTELRWKDGATYVFSAAGYLTAQKDRYNNQITITRDLTNQITQIQDPTGRAVTITYTLTPWNNLHYSVIRSITDPAGRTVSYGYDLGRLAWVNDPNGGRTSYTYDGFNRLLSITDPKGLAYLTNQYDTNSRITRQVLADGGYYKFAYTLAGSTVTQTTVTDPRGNVRTYTFNAAQYLATATASGQLTTYNRQTGTNDLNSVTDALNRVTTYTYDANGNVASILDPENNLTQFQYEPTFSRLTQITDALTPANVTIFAYNDVARTTTITNPLNKQTVIQCNSAGQPTSITDPLSHATTFSYDSLGNLATTTDALSNVTTRQYDAVSRLLALIDPRGKVTRFGYDPLNRVTQIQDSLNGLTTFAYDPNGNLLTVKDAKNQTTTYTYDAMDRLATRKDPLNRQESYQYDKAGNLSQFTDRKSQVTTFGYDVLNRRTTATYVGSSTTFGYDAIGRLTSVNDSLGGTLTWVYDVVGKHPRVAETTSAGTMTVEYDETGRRFKLSATGQGDTTYGYDAASQFKTVTKGTQTVTLNYDDAGRRSSLTYPNGVVSSYGYDNANRLLTLTHVKTPTTIESLTYSYDKSGNRTQLVRANAVASIVPTAVTAANISYDAANELLRWNNATNNMTYDLNGNLATETVSGVTTTYTWDSRNRLTGISKTGLTASFIYDGLGRRKSKTVNGATTGYWYDGNDLYAELSGVTPSFTYIRGLSIDEPYIRKGTNDEFYETDALGSPVRLTNAAGTAPVTYTYEPFGKTTQSGTSSNPFQFTGRENDGTTGLYYYRARYYYPKVQRFMGEDPIRFSRETQNLYAYVLNNPINNIDPSGKIPLYGNYCGAGANLSPPIDDLDTACREHDFCYGDAGLDGAQDAFGKNRDVNKCRKQNECDDELCRRAQRFVPKTATGFLARKVVMELFCD